MDEQTIEIETRGLRFSALACGEGPLVLCAHGFPDHPRSFRHQLRFLADAGYRAVAPTMRGYAPSCQPGHEIALYHPLEAARDIIEWARALSGEEPVHLLGHDWGGIAGFFACQLEPERFHSFCSVAVPCAQAIEAGIRAHPSQLRNSWYMMFFQLRGLADRVVAARDFAFLEKLWRDWSPGWQWEPEEMVRLKQTFRRPGVLGAALAYYRATLNPFLTDTKLMRSMTHEPTHVRVLAVTGERDGCMDTRLFDYADRSLFTRGLRTVRMEHAGHFAHQERPADFNQLLGEWLDR